MQINGAAALVVTVADRGVGERVAEALLERGAAKVYAGASGPGSISTPGVVPVRLDIADPQQVRAPAEAAPEVALLIDNARLTTGSDVLASSFDIWQFDTHVLGTFRISRTFAPVLAGDGGTCTARRPVRAVPARCPAHRRLHRGQVRPAVPHRLPAYRSRPHMGLMDTRIATGQDTSKAGSAQVASPALDAIAARAYEAMADDMSRHVRAALSGDLGHLSPPLGDQA
jgi:hypothetical protein